MSVESAWDDECAAAAQTMADDVRWHHDRNFELMAEVERLTKKLDVANAVIVGYRRLIDEASRTRSFKVDL